MNKHQETLRNRILPELLKLDRDPSRPLSIVAMECIQPMNMAKLMETLHDCYQPIGTTGYGCVSNRGEIQRGFYFCDGATEEIMRFNAVAKQAGRCLGDWVNRVVSSEVIAVANDPLQNWIRVLCDLAWSENPRFPIEADQWFYPQSEDGEVDLRNAGPWLRPIEADADPAAMRTVLVDVVQASIYAVDVLTSVKPKRVSINVQRNAFEIAWKKTHPKFKSQKPDEKNAFLAAYNKKYPADKQDSMKAFRNARSITD